MKVHYEWLLDICTSCEMEAQKAADLLTMAGLNVESVQENEDGETVLDVEVTSNRPDCLSYQGIARELGVLTGFSPKYFPDDVSAREVDSLECVSINIPESARDLCPRYTGRVVRNVEVTPSPDWMQKRLRASGIQPVNNVVDITNYVLLERGQPLHAFDLQKISGSSITARRAKDGESIEALNGQSYEMKPDQLVIADEEGPVAVAGVIGGADSEVQRHTEHVLLESALFDSVSVRHTARDMGVSTESSYRFERKPDPQGVEEASRRAAYLMEEIAGGEVQEAYVDRNFLSEDQLAAKVQNLRIDRVNDLLGVSIDISAAKDILQGLGFQVISEDDGRAMVEIPSFRQDVTREVDLIEEVGRIYGYDRIPEEPDLAQTLPDSNRKEQAREAVRSILPKYGYQEVVTFPFLEDEEQGVPSYWQRPNDDGQTVEQGEESSDSAEDREEEEGVGIIGADGQVERYLRKSLISTFLRVIRTNEGYGMRDVSFFEVGRSFQWDIFEENVLEQEILGMVRSDGFSQIKGDLEAIINRLLEETPRFVSSNHPLLTPGYGAEIYVSHFPVGYVGRLRDGYHEQFEIQNELMVAELDFSLLLHRSVLHKRYESFSRYPRSEKDLSFIADESMEWETMKRCTFAVAPPILEEVKLFDVFAGEGIPEGKKSIAVRLVFRSNEGTLNSETLRNSMKQIVSGVEDRLPVELRGEMD